MTVRELGFLVTQLRQAGARVTAAGDGLEIEWSGGRGLVTWAILEEPIEQIYELRLFGTLDVHPVVAAG